VAKTWSTILEGKFFSPAIFDLFGQNFGHLAILLVQLRSGQVGGGGGGGPCSILLKLYTDSEIFYKTSVTIVSFMGHVKNDTNIEVIFCF